MLNELRILMNERNIAAYIIPNKDPHLSEYLPAHFSLMPKLSGFTGSTGTMIITQDFAGVWTDSRYFIQAEEELKNSPFELVKLDIPHTPQHIDWLKEKLSASDKVGIDAQLFSVSAFRQLKKELGTKGIEIVFDDLVTPVWKDRPELPNNTVFEHEVRFAGRSRVEKINAIREEMQTQGCTYYLQTALDDVAWTFNLRCDDVAYNPVAVSYALIGLNSATLFMNLEKVPLELAEKFDNEGISLRSYHSIFDYLGALEKEETLYLDLRQVNAQLYNLVAAKCQIKTGLSFAYFAKAIKNETEIANIKNVMLKDGVALVRFFRWLEANVGSGEVTEVVVAEELRSCRAAQENFIGESFSTIAGYKGNGAIVHYRAKAETCATLQPEGIFLLDSGGQYLDGTTDITRTVALGRPTDLQVRDNTLVLKGHIAVASAQFPAGTSGNQIESFARAALWRYGLNYGHGTGHGVGFFLNVHEGPHSFGRAASAYKQAYFHPGMLITNEPGYYKEGEYGIRIENLLLVVESPYEDFYKFENLSWFPLDKNLINKNLLTKDEIDWINWYHQTTFEKLSPFLNEEETAWLKQKTEMID